MPPQGSEIHLRIPELRRLFDPMDPSRSSRKDLAPRVEEFNVSWGREIPTKNSLALVLHLDQPPAEDELGDAVAAIHAYFVVAPVSPPTP